MSNLALGSGTVGHSHEVRGDDLYETPLEAVQVLCDRVRLPDTIWEPACGPGAITMPLRERGHTIIATDLVDYGCPESASARDFLMEYEMPAGASAIVTNPPFKLAEQFVSHAKTMTPNVIMLLRLAFLEGLRWERGLARGLERVIVFAPRLPFMHRHGYDGPRQHNSGMPFAWYVWSGTVGRPTIEWANWREYGEG